MKYTVWTMYDKKTGIYQEPTFYRTDAVALASFSRSIKSEVARNPHMKDIYTDFVFVKIAEFNDSTGKFWTINEELRQKVDCESLNDDHVYDEYGNLQDVIDDYSDYESVVDDD